MTESNLEQRYNALLAEHKVLCTTIGRVCVELSTGEISKETMDTLFQYELTWNTPTGEPMITPGVLNQLVKDGYTSYDD